MATSPYTCILWDVDGTVADASRGILDRLREVLTAYGRPAPTTEELSLWIGPPLYESFALRGGFEGDELDAVTAAYRAAAARDGYASTVDLYPGIAELIRELHAAGVPQSTASTKAENQVLAILEHFELMPSFTAVSGARPGPEGRLDGKEFVVAQALARLEAAGVDVSRPVLIGDRHHDVEGGKAHGIPVIFVTWGFGEAGEAEGAIRTVSDTSELREHLIRQP